MTQAIPKPQTKPVTFDDFIAWYPENSEHRYELHEGVIVEMPKPKGKHSEVAGFTSGEVFLEIRRLQLPYFIPKESIVKSVDGESGYEPDVIVLDRDAVASEPRWERESIITMGSSIRLIVEVVSTNWQDDYLTKLRDVRCIRHPRILDCRLFRFRRKASYWLPKTPNLQRLSVGRGRIRSATLPRRVKNHITH